MLHQDLPRRLHLRHCVVFRCPHDVHSTLVVSVPGRPDHATGYCIRDRAHVNPAASAQLLPPGSVIVERIAGTDRVTVHEAPAEPLDRMADLLAAAGVPR